MSKIDGYKKYIDVILLLMLNLNWKIYIFGGENKIRLKSKKESKVRT